MRFNNHCTTGLVHYKYIYIQQQQIYILARIKEWYYIFDTVKPFPDFPVENSIATS